MTEAFIQYCLFLACLGVVLSLIAGTVAALWSAVKKRRSK